MATTTTRSSILNTTLFSLHTPSGPDEIEKLIGTSSYLLRYLNNPYNIQVLTSNLCASSALWAPYNPGTDLLYVAKKLLECYIAAARAVVQSQSEPATEPSELEGDLTQQQPRLKIGPWIRAVQNGLGLKNGNIPSKWAPGTEGKEWMASLILSGIVHGLALPLPPSSDPNANIPDHSPQIQDLINNLAITSVLLSNTVLERQPQYPPFAVPATTIALAVLPLQKISTPLPLSTAFAVPILEAMLGPTGLRDGEALIIPLPPPSSTGQLHIPPSTPAFRAWNSQWSKSPHLGLLSPLLSLFLLLAKNAPTGQLGLFIPLIDRLLTFSQLVFTHWHSSPFSEVEPLEPGRHLTPQTLESWSVLDSYISKVAVVTVSALKDVVGRLLGGRGLMPDTAAKCLRTLRNMGFATQGRISSSTVYGFVLGACVDVLSTSPAQCDEMLVSLAPGALPIPSALPSTRTVGMGGGRSARLQTLFFLSFAETVLSSPGGSLASTGLIASTALGLLTPEAAVYLHSPGIGAGGGKEIWEGAHVTVLSLLSTMSSPSGGMGPAEMTPGGRGMVLDGEGLGMIESYLQTLLTSYPHHLSLQQLVLGFTSLVRATANLPQQLLIVEILRYHATTPNTFPSTSPAMQSQPGQAQDLDTRSAYTLVLTQTLLHLPPAELSEWLELTYHAMALVSDVAQRGMLERAFRGVLSGMDPVRGVIAAGWWCGGAQGIEAMGGMGGMGGGQGVDGEGEGGEMMMSGALGGDGAGERESWRL